MSSPPSPLFPVRPVPKRPASSVHVPAIHVGSIFHGLAGSLHTVTHLVAVVGLVALPVAVVVVGRFVWKLRRPLRV